MPRRSERKARRPRDASRSDLARARKRAREAGRSAQAKAIDALLRDDTTGEGPTSETVVNQSRALDELDKEDSEEFGKPARGDALARLKTHGVIDADQLRAGREIASIVEAVTAGVNAHAGRFERGSGAAPRDRISARLAVLHRDRYRPWAEQARRSSGIAAVQLVLAVAVDGLSLTRAARRRGMRKEKARLLLQAGLSVYVALARRTRMLEDRDVVRADADREERALSGLVPVPWSR